MKKYIIYSKYDSNYEDTIDESVYNELLQSKEILFEARSKENIYNIVLMNYYEFEKELFEVSLKDEMFTADYLTLNEYVSKVEQRVLNLLSSITLYLDSFNGDDLKGFEKYSEYIKDEFKVVYKFIQNSVNTNKKLKIVKFLRNHIQHNGLLKPDALFNGRNLSDELREQTVNFHINKNKIKANYFKLENFTELEEQIDLKIYIREYIDFISNIHHQCREITKEKTTNARSSFESILEQYREHKYLCVAKSVNENRIDEITILLDWDDVRVELVKKNRVPKAFKRHSINTK